jgi:D-glycero-alpha-D-manno-heptose-7-phosphate kinase
MAGSTPPARSLHATAPIRVCDLGGWTDTWFAGHGTVVHLAVSPLVHVDVTARLRQSSAAAPVIVHAVDYGDRYEVVPDDPHRTPRHPLLEAAIDEVGVDDDTSLEITVHSEAPPGCSTGTSAAVAVALVGALDAARADTHRTTPMDIARTAHRLETERLGLQSGIQDQLASAFGGVNLVEMAAYPEATVTPVPIPATARTELDDRLVVVFLGRRHDSSAVHETVIADLQGEGPASRRLDALRTCARRGLAALSSGDLAAFGRVMIDNTDAQAALHAGLVGAEAAAAIDVARRHGCAGWKVNGAGGEGGSVTLLLGAAHDRTTVIEALTAEDPSFAVLPSRLAADGLRIRTGGPASTRPSR